jgi:hypothetical protein
MRLKSLTVYPSIKNSLAEPGNEDNIGLLSSENINELTQ